MTQASAEWSGAGHAFCSRTVQWQAPHLTLCARSVAILHPRITPRRPSRDGLCRRRDVWAMSGDDEPVSSRAKRLTTDEAPRWGMERVLFCIPPEPPLDRKFTGLAQFLAEGRRRTRSRSVSFQGFWSRVQRPWEGRQDLT